MINQMNRKRKNAKTDLVAILILIVLLVGAALVAFEKATLTEVAALGAAITSLLTALGFRFSADAQKESDLPSKW
jgi:TRAP-type mannitol/chloroaromatic compound transport system permease large subunit